MKYSRKLPDKLPETFRNLPDTSKPERVNALAGSLQKNNKDFETADAIRDQLLELGVEINDSSDGTEWKLRS